MGFRLTEVVKSLLIINVIMYIGTMMMGDSRGMFALFYPESELFKPYQIATHMFMHGDLFHLFFNMYSLVIFGAAVETRMGTQRFLMFYLLTGFGAAILHTLVQYLELHYFGTGNINAASWGASGSIFGVLAAFGLLFPNTQLQLIFPPIGAKAKYMVLFFIGLELFLGVQGMNSGIAHFAHLGGALFGFLLIQYWRMR